MPGAPYTPCKLYVDGLPSLSAGEYLRTLAGSAYLVQSIRQNRRQPQRRHLDCLRWPLAEIPAEAVVHTFYWYSRNKKAARTLQSLG